MKFTDQVSPTFTTQLQHNFLTNNTFLCNEKKIKKIEGLS